MRSAFGKRDPCHKNSLLWPHRKARLTRSAVPNGNLGGARSFQKPPLKANVVSGWGYRLDPRHFGPSNFLVDRFLWHFGAVPGLCKDGNELPTKATKELPPQLLSLLPQRSMPKRSPILIRLFKEESELEVWKQDTTGHFELLKVYPICRWSGDLGPKITEGDRQAPEGFYTITPGLMNPNSNYYLAINTGFPNAYDRANDRHGGFLMISGDCSSRGCYAMTDEQIGEIYSLARESTLGGQPSFRSKPIRSA